MSRHEIRKLSREHAGPANAEDLGNHTTTPSDSDGSSGGAVRLRDLPEWHADLGLADGGESAGGDL